MKTKLLFVCGVCLALAGTRRVYAKPFDEAKGSTFYALSHPAFKEPIAPTREELRVDEAIVALSKTSKFNLIADVTSIGADTHVAPFPASPLARAQKWTPTFGSVSGDLQEAAGLAALPFDDSTFLLWKRPDVVETANALLVAGKLNAPPLPDEFGIARTLGDFRKNSTGWTTDLPDFSDLTLRVGDVPSATRAPILSLLRYAMLRPDLKRELLLSDSFWKTARVKVAPNYDTTTGKNAPVVFVGGQDENGQATPFLRVFGDSPLEPLDGDIHGSLYPVVPVGVDAPLAPIEEEAAPVVPGLTATELEDQARLQTPISFEIKRRPLSSVLADVTKQSGIALSQTPNVPAILVTARIEKMPLSGLMAALGRLCGASWHQSATGYELQEQPMEPWQKLLLQSGQGDFQSKNTISQFDPDFAQSLRDLEQAIVDESGDEAGQPEGAPVSALSDDVQTQLKQRVQNTAASALVRAYTNAFVFGSPEGMLHLIPPHHATVAWRVQLLGADNVYTLAVADVRLPPIKEDANTPVQDGEPSPALGAP